MVTHHHSRAIWFPRRLLDVLSSFYKNISVAVPTFTIGLDDAVLYCCGGSLAVPSKPTGSGYTQQRSDIQLLLPHFLRLPSPFYFLFFFQLSLSRLFHASLFSTSKSKSRESNAINSYLYFMDIFSSLGRWKGEFLWWELKDQRRFSPAQVHTAAAPYLSFPT